MSRDNIEITMAQSLADIDPQDWDVCANPGGQMPPADPFVTYRFLRALEASGSVGEGTGWHPHYLLARENGALIAYAPMYLKTHSQGEYIFDFNWAQAYEQAGGQYYPKLQIAVPFTPATGRRFLCKQGVEAKGQAALTEAMVKIASDNHLSSAHVTFCSEAEAIAGADMGLMHRKSTQFHWVNQGYSDFDDFLAALSSRKRKNIRKERGQAQGFGGEIHALTGDQIQPEHWNAFWHFYQDTGARKWGTPYLTREFFDEIQRDMRDDVLLVLAERDGRYLAGALNFIGADTLFGRYWGCVEDHPALHFELCYYQAIEFAITEELQRVEAGAQGEHKLARGYLPVECHSLHWIGDAGFSEAVQRFIRAEAAAIGQDIEVLSSYGPFKIVEGEQDETE
ncbi:GNAT family N-acetyltransferase [Thalassobius sp. I31.1]|uniref:GNAT family N-acetyltransferase n=1 Tax=Thalassobius sp. I31.1 TaxID=2109912 RepID=UPI000D1B679D|nr:GNAT family N-acetyltransferase [Thalassobius sp. I31.1]